MNRKDILMLYEYTYWATRRILAAGAEVSPEAFQARTAPGFGSLRGTLVHALDAECGWRMLCQHGTLASFNAMKEEAFPTMDVLAERWNEEERAMRDYLAGLTDRDLPGPVRYTTPEGVTRERVLWHCLVHVVNHGTHHRSQAAMILRGHGRSPGALDLTAFLNEHPQG